jgi:2-amino-4-hydroxy-6-hydroxymethyldihydropteridine diphosphokinase
MSAVYIGIGSNVGDKKDNLEEAVRRLEATGRFSVLKRSSFYRTSPAGGPPQEDYLNGVLKTETDLSPGECLDLFKGIEEDMGRTPAGRDHPRVIDLDMLLYDDLVIETDELTVPHPRMDERYFVLRGFNEIAPEAVHPVRKKTVEELCRLSRR